MKNILIVGAHFDDSELGAGGTAAKFSENGMNVYKITLTDNVTQFVQKNISVDYMSSKMQSSKACEVLGVRELDFECEECSKLSYSKEVMQRVEKIIFDYKIDTVFIHFGTDMNRDHVEANKICLTAARHCDNIFEFQSNGYILDDVFYPTFFVNISDYVDKKRDALSQYGIEHNRFNRLFDVNIERNHIWGYANEVEYAEGFRVVKMLDNR
ncbi:MAG: PIG-L family deacetylase [Oscillospiraceae bacterium]|nr:PIG-L family deacetylase [Oscillospiraceae bacterium]